MALIYLLILWKIPEYYVCQYLELSFTKEQIEAIKGLREMLISFAGGIILIFGLYFTWRRTEAIEEQNMINRTNNESNYWLAQFSKASELLKEDSISAKISGVYLFEKIMNNCEEYHWSVIEILSAYVREHRSILRYFKREETEQVWENNMDSSEYLYTLKKIASEQYQKRSVCEHECRILSYTFREFDKLQNQEYVFDNMDIDQVCESILNVLSQRNLKFEKFGKETVEDLYNLYKSEINNENSKLLASVIKKLEKCRKIDLSYCYFVRFSSNEKSFLLFNFNSSIFVNCELLNLVFDFSHINAVIFSDSCKIRRCFFLNSQLRETLFKDDTNIYASYFDHSRLEYVAFNETNIKHSTFEHVPDLAWSSFKESTLYDCSFKGASLPNYTIFINSKEIEKCYDINNYIFNKTIGGKIERTVKGVLNKEGES